MIKITSKTVSISRSAEDLFSFLSDFRNFGGLLPEQVEQWQSTADQCSFKIKGMSNFGMRIKERCPFHEILIENDPAVSMPLSFLFRWHFTPAGEFTTVVAAFEIDVNPFMGSMIKTPLQHFSDRLVDALKQKMDT